MRPTATDTLLMKLGAGLLSSIASSVWCIAWGTLLIWLPSRFGAREAVNGGGA